MPPTGDSPPAPTFRDALQVEEDVEFQRRTWTIERIGWIVMTAVAIAGLLGVFSVGPLSSAAREDPAGLIRVEYERFQRHMSPTTLRVSLLQMPAAGETVSLRLSQSLLEAVQIEHIQPRPERASVAADGTLLTFRREGTDQRGAIRLFIRPQTIGSARGEIGMAGQEPAALTVFVYP